MAKRGIGLREYKISVITVCLNSEATIRQTIESVLRQTYKNIEYIIVDGGSVDRTLTIIREYIPLSDGRMRYISEKDDGIYDAMNKGITMATGDIVGIINSDDWYEPEAVEEIVKCFRATDTDVAYGEEWILNENRQREYHTYRMGFPPHPGMFVRREVYQKYGMYDLSYRIASDWDLILRFMAGGIRFERIDRVIANYSKTGISSVRILECAEETHEIELKYLEKDPGTFLNKNNIEESYDRARLLHVSSIKPLAVKKILEETCAASKGVVVFGVGACGKELAKILDNCDIPICFYVDNDAGKWGLSFNGIKIFSPEILRDYSGHVVITATRFQKDIGNQLKGYSNPALSWSILSEVRSRVINECGLFG